MSDPVLQVHDDGRVRLITLDRPDALNAFNEALYDATAEALIDAAAAPEVAVVVLTGTGRAFSAGTDVAEMAARTVDPDGFQAGTHGFPGLIDQLTEFPKPLLCAVNGMALGIGATLLGYAELVVMSTDARIRCPFTDLAVAPEAASSYLFPRLLGHQQASWLLMSSEWFSAEDCERMGLAWRVTAPERAPSRDARARPPAGEQADRLAGGDQAHDRRRAARPDPRRPRTGERGVPTAHGRAGEPRGLRRAQGATPSGLRRRRRRSPTRHRGPPRRLTPPGSSAIV